MQQLQTSSIPGSLTGVPSRPRGGGSEPYTEPYDHAGQKAVCAQGLAANRLQMTFQKGPVSPPTRLFGCKRDCRQSCLTSAISSMP